MPVEPPYGSPRRFFLRRFYSASVWSTGALLFLSIAACADRAPTSADAPAATVGGLSLAAIISASSDTVRVGQTLQLSAVWKEKGLPVVDLTAVWWSSDATIASVSSKGLVTAKKAGVVWIATISYGLKMERRLTVLPAVAPPDDGDGEDGDDGTDPGPQPQPPQGSLPVLSGKAIIGDDFSSYGSTAALQTAIGVGKMYGAFNNEQLISLDNTVTYNGHATMRYDQPGGQATTPQLWPHLPNGAALKNVWFRAVIRFSPGFTTTGTLPLSANAYKLLGFGWANDFGRATLEITNTTQYQAAAGTQDGDMPTQFVIAGGIVNEWKDGAWYDYVMHYQVTSPTTARLRVWHNRGGTSPVLAGTLNLTTKQYAAPSVGFLTLGLNFNQVRAASKSQALWYGMWEAVDGSTKPNPFGIPGG
jgi:hypothetical protein